MSPATCDCCGARVPWYLDDEGVPSRDDLQPASIYDFHTTPSAECAREEHTECPGEGVHSEYGVPDGHPCTCECHNGPTS